MFAVRSCIIGCLVLATLAAKIAAEPPAHRTSPSSTSQRDRLLADDARLQAEQAKLAAAGRLAEARVVGEQRLKVARQMLAESPSDSRQAHTNVVSLLIDKASLCLRQLDPIAAKTAADDALAHSTRAFGQSHWITRSADQFAKTVNRIARLTADQRRRLIEADTNAQAAVAARRFEEATPLLAELQHEERQALEPDDPWHANTQLLLAYCSQQRLKLNDAESQLRAALAIRQKAYGDEHPDVVYCRDALAALARQRLQIAEALRWYRQAAPSRRKLLNTSSPNDAGAWFDDLQTDSRRQYRITAAADWQPGSLKLQPPDAIGRALPGTPWCAAEFDIRWPEAAGHDSPSEIQLEIAFKGTAGRQIVRWLRQPAGEALNERLALEKIASQPDGAEAPGGESQPPVVANRWQAERSKQQQRLSVLYRAGLLSVLIDGQQRLSAFDVAQLAPESWTLRAAAGPIIIETCASAGQLDPPLTPADQSQVVAAKTDLERAGEFAAGGDMAQAVALVEKSRAAFNSKLGSEHQLTAYASLQLADYLYQARNYESERPIVQQALDSCRKIYGPEHPMYARALDAQGRYLQSQARFAEAEPLFKQALAIREATLGPAHSAVADTLDDLSALYWQWHSDCPQLAAAYATRALEAHMRGLEQNAAVSTEQEQQFEASRSTAPTANLWLSITQRQPATAEAVWQSLLAWKGWVTTRQLRLRQLVKDDPLYTEFRQTSQQLSNFERNLPEPPGELPTTIKGATGWWHYNKQLKDWQQRKAELLGRHAQLEMELNRKSAGYWREHQPHRATADDVREALGKQSNPTALVDVLEYGLIAPQASGSVPQRRTAAFVIRPGQPVVRVELGPSQPIADAVAGWRSSYGLAAAGVDHGAELRRLVWQPLAPHLKGIDTLLVSPDGPLGQVPWGALPGDKPGSFLVEQLAIAVIPVPQLLPELLSQKSHRGLPESLLLVGDIDYGGEPGMPRDLLATAGANELKREGQFSFDALPGGLKELEAIDGRYEAMHAARLRATILRGQSATEAAFREQVSRYQWVHLVTHGFFAPDAFRLRLSDSLFAPSSPGLMSGLAFAGANARPRDDSDDGILTAMEVSALNLVHVDGVVLSACETGLGQLVSGEGLLGLQRSFQIAGAKTVVASLWKVPDAATGRLMQHFYENLWDKQLGKLAALRQAQLSMLAEARSGSMSGKQSRGLVVGESINEPLLPFFWAAFVLSGDWR